jgi:hypothetical protein
MRDSINLIMDFYIKKKGVDIWSNGKILLPKSILEEIWYGNRGLHLFGAPIRIFKS